MKCGRCGVNEAGILIKQVFNGKESEFSLCEKCAKAIGLAIQSGVGVGFNSSLFFPGNFFSALNHKSAATQVNTGVFVPGKSGTGICENCKTTLQEFKEKGKLGCSLCYEAFDDQLSQVFRRIQSGEVHRGRKLAEPAESLEIRILYDRIGKLQGKIKKAVEVEDYESAAKYKTEIERVKLDIDKMRLQKGESVKSVGKVNKVSGKSSAVKKAASGKTASAKKKPANDRDKSPDKGEGEL